ncbi:DMT family transporter [Clostridium saccharobutylicum]|uniref:Protein LicB n=1 Tax=Clostridium saccharobutylicum DSM 13864 TaxID=1345695 RepID=U5MWY3_CLOSA|nr:DMT family transporter [Clostridium saccharobutylicum]AGX45105.1 protein LicB [Clostridium saccharobutylicum DSM 13864]AQR92387.1 EamA-like transporter family protein [Clostridium saccharobutylicum]AQS02290.1 EamA-like transporter family protein [Clostridium saccharobutylicum]AQS16273.1 EamA-like transporter family protein [Clostridium saccharobutylicum]MBA2904948.1 drug/metabolite transporter (DMT)-like permease [Clostridium saccharobutylicum]
MEGNRNNYKIGVLTGLGSAITWGIDTVLMAIILAMSPFSSEGVIVLAPILTACFHDAFSAVWTFIYLSLKKQLRPLIKAMKTRSGAVVALAAIMGGPVGMTGYVMAIQYIGPSYTAIISSLYPAFGAILAYLILKEKIGKKGWIGLFVAILGIVLIGYSPNESGISIVGFIWALVCAIGWGSESVICAIGMKADEVSAESALQIRQLTSGIVYSALIVPMVGGIGMSIEALRTNSVWYLIAVALSGTASYLFYYQSIDKIGATKAMGLNSTNTVFAIIFDVLINGTQLSLKTIICSLMVMGGVYLMAKVSEEEIKETSEFA